MVDSLLVKLEASRKELLDLGLRNPLLNYRLSKARGIHVIDERPEYVFEILVQSNRAMTFVVSDTRKYGKEQQESYSDSKLQTNESDKSLESRLLNTYYAARTSIEEQGVNILFLALGMLEWYESDISEELRKAPLILIPVTLERVSAKEKFKLKYSSEEIGGNISLKAKLKNEFHIDLPDLPEIEDLKITSYFKSIEESIVGQQRWKVDDKSVELGFFSFGKFMLYNDLDNSKWPDGKKPVDHNLLKQLFETGFSDTALSAGEDSFIDNETNAHELYQVVDADSSQILAMLAVHEGKNLVIQGPPGTGKSQTITNILAHAIGNGKKVLFVAEKMTALEVVKRRLDYIGLGDSCLELHSHKANKKELLQELKRVIDLGKPTVDHLERRVALLGDTKEELNDYCFAINSKVAKSEYSANQLMGFLLKIKERTSSIDLPRIELAGMENWDRVQFDKAIGISEKIQARLNEIGIPERMLFYGAGITLLLPTEEEVIREKILALKDSLDNLLNVIKRSQEVLNISCKSIEQVELLIDVWIKIESRPLLSGFNISNSNWRKSSELGELIKAGIQIMEIKTAYESVLIQEAWDLDVVEIRQNMIEHGQKWYRYFISSFRSSVKKLSAYCKKPLPKEYSLRLGYIDAILTFKRKELIIKEYADLTSSLFGTNWKQLKTDWQFLNRVCNYLIDLHISIDANRFPDAVLNYIEANKDLIDNISFSQEIKKAKELFLNKREHLFEALKFDHNLKSGETNINKGDLINELEVYSTWLGRLPEIHKVVSWNVMVELLKENNLSELIKLSASWEYASGYLKVALEKSWFQKLLNLAISNSSSLKKFERNSHEEAINKFRELDKINFQLKIAKVAEKHWEGIPSTNAGGQVNVLKTEFNKKSRHLPIRKLMNEAGLAVQALKPVFMMSPLSVANFIPQGVVEFDLVVFDEASQIKPVDAIGAIIRAKQLVVVGDTKQLPPSSFFDSILKDDDIDDDQESVTIDMQSILGMCSSNGVRESMLRWHYRSRHESLINVSNQEFYNNKLIVFPSPRSKSKLGLIFHHLKDTFYDRGKTRTNLKEAEIVAEAAIRHARNNPKQTLGIVAFSNAQRQAIENMLELKRKTNLDVEEFFEKNPHEKFFIKNLESVQGDERDVIFISIGYGKSEGGIMTMNFGPVSRNGGERRLNVLITRAKQRCEVFTNITADDIDLSRTKLFGVSSLKNFLYYAQYGRLNTIKETGREADSPFEESVCHVLQKNGYQVKKQVGSNGFFIDLAIVDSENPGRYIIGIECDGASYHSSRSARDRDRLRQQVLEANGWILYRVWSTDWFKNPERELEKLVLAIKKASYLLANDNVETEQVSDTQHNINREETIQEEELIPSYEFAVLSKYITSLDLHLFPLVKLAEMVEKVVQKESPVHFDEVARRVVEAHDIAKIGSRIREAIENAVRYAYNKGTIKKKGEFLWLPTMEKPTIRNRCEFASASKKFKFISPEEISLAILKVVESSIAIDKENAAVLVAKMLGFNRTTEDMKDEIFMAIDELIKNRQIIMENGILRNI